MMIEWVHKNMEIFHYIGTIVGLLINAGLIIAVYRKHIKSDSKKDMKIALMWAKFVKDNDLNGSASIEVQD